MLALLCVARRAVRLEAALRRPARDARRRRRPRRIVSLVPATTEMLFAMGAGDRHRRRQQLRPLSARGRAASASRRAARSGRRARPVAEARPGHRLRHADGSEAAARTRRHADVPLRAPRPAGHHARRCGRSARGSAPGPRPTPRRRASSSSSPRSARRVAGRPRPKTLLVFGREQGALRHINASGGYGFLHDVLELAGGADVLGDLQQAVGRDEHRDDPDARARGHPRAALRRLAEAASAWTPNGGSGTRCRRCRR